MIKNEKACKHGYKSDGFCKICSNEPGQSADVEAIKYPQPEPCPVGYEELDRVLFEAFNQSAHGKGKSRHANDKAFPNQPIMTIGRMVGVGGHSYQIMKKAQEATNMSLRGEHDAAIVEFRGAIIYAAAAILLIEEKGNGSK